MTENGRDEMDGSEASEWRSVVSDAEANHDVDGGGGLETGTPAWEDGSVTVCRAACSPAGN